MERGLPTAPCWIDSLFTAKGRSFSGTRVKTAREVLRSTFSTPSRNTSVMYCTDSLFLYSSADVETAAASACATFWSLHARRPTMWARELRDRPSFSLQLARELRKFLPKWLESNRNSSGV